MRNALGDAAWAPFRSQCDWEVACWAKMRGPSSSAVTELLAIPEVVERLGLSYSTSNELNSIIDKLPGPPPFKSDVLEVGGEHLQFHHRDIILCIQALFGKPEFARDLVFAPERHYADAERICRVYSEMHTGDWWWSVQTSLESIQLGATVVPVIISSDKTQLTLFRGKSAYPIYLTIGNIPKDIRRKPSRGAQMLIGYIPSTRLEGIGNKAARRRALANLFHACMDKVLSPIHSYGEDGIVMMSGDGTWRRCHPIFAAFVGDYPEQTLVTCTYNGRCPKCTVPRGRLGEFLRFPARDLTNAFDTFLLADENTSGFHAACREAGLKPIYHPFWQHLPLANIYISITPDVLHQLLQGVLKHLVSWLTSSVIFGAREIDARCRCLPPNHHITLFPKGITGLSRISGKEHKAMCRILIGLIVDISLPGGRVPSRVVRATRALLDFIYLAQFPSHTAQTLQRLEDSLATFHQNKDIFVDVGVRENFNIPKLHSLLHYGHSITLFGTTDHYNTEQTERLHIDFTKDAYRATNRKDEYPQMTAWVERREKVQAHITYVEWRQRNHTAPVGHLQSSRFLKMAQHPTFKAVSFEDLAERYGAVDFQDCLADFIAQLNHPGASAAVLRARAADTLLPFRTVPVFHRIKFTSSGSSGNSKVVDSVVVRPEQNDARGRTIPSRFDTVLVRGRHEDVMHGNHGNRIAQVRVVFQLPDRVIPNLFSSSDTTIPSYLAYVEWFSPLSATPDNNNLMYKVSRLIHQDRRRAAIIPVESVLCSVHLLPRLTGPVGPHNCNSFSVLDQCSTFYVNPFSDRYIYLKLL
ncbi:hypothetical protein H4582DRAFT_1827220 [Lactarius indigo]|nr:hypothetical protein H4582DRAFT_1827220 [Lactarius indigo]